MKKIGFALIFAVFVILFSFKCAAYETSEQETIASKSGATTLSNGEYFSDDEINGKEKINVGGKIFGVIKDSLSKFYRNVLKSFYMLITIVIFSSVFAAFKWTSANGTLHTAFEFASVLVISGLCFSILKNVFSFAVDSLNSLCSYMNALLPVTASLYSLGGNISAGVAGSSSLILFLTVCQNITDNFLFPLLEGGFVLSISSALPNGVNLQSVTNFAKNLLTSLLAFMFSIFGFVMYFQTIITAASDNYAFRTVKFASGTLIPVIGSMLGDAARTVTASVGVIKSTVGAIGIVTILALTLPPIIYAFMHKMIFLICAMIARALGCERESRLLYDINSVLSVLLAIVIGSAVMFIIAAALFIRIGVGE